MEKYPIINFLFFTVLFLIVYLVYWISSNSLFGNGSKKIILSILLAFPLALVMAHFSYNPIILMIILFPIFRNIIKSVDVEKYKLINKEELNINILKISTYSFILISCILGLLLQSEFIVGDKSIPLLDAILNWNEIMNQ